MSTSSRYIPVECTFMAGGEVVRDTIYFKRWVKYLVTTSDESKNKLFIVAEDGSEKWTVVGVTAFYAVPKLKHGGLNIEMAR